MHVHVQPVQDVACAISTANHQHKNGVHRTTKRLVKLSYCYMAWYIHSFSQKSISANFTLFACMAFVFCNELIGHLATGQWPGGLSFNCTFYMIFIVESAIKKQQRQEGGTFYNIFTQHIREVHILNNLVFWPFLCMFLALSESHLCNVFWKRANPSSTAHKHHSCQINVFFMALPKINSLSTGGMDFLIHS